MRISQLATATGVPVATVKFYLREGLLLQGRRTSATQAQYDDSHVARLRLIRALIGVGGLSVAAARQVLAQLDDPPPGVHDLLGVAQDAITPRAEPDADLSDVDALIRRWGWHIDDRDCDVRAMLARSLAAVEEAGFELPDGALDLYAQAMHEVAAHEVAHVPVSSLPEAVRYVVLGTVLVEPILLAIRRLAQQDVSARRFELGH